VGVKTTFVADTVTCGSAARVSVESLVGAALSLAL